VNESQPPDHNVATPTKDSRLVGEFAEAVKPIRAWLNEDYGYPSVWLDDRLVVSERSDRGFLGGSLLNSEGDPFAIVVLPSLELEAAVIVSSPQKGYHRAPISLPPQGLWDNASAATDKGVTCASENL